MPPRKDKNKITDEIESSAAASKRRRIEILNGMNGVPFTNPITQFPSIHLLRNPPQNTTTMATDLNLSPPTPYQQPDVDDSLISSLIPQQNFIINYHINQMLQNMEQFWRRNLSEELKKRVEMESKIKEKEQQTDLFRQMYHFYEQKSFHLEETLRRRADGEGCGNAVPAVALEEEVQSCLFDLNSVQRMDMMCKNCRSRPATMLWLPCRHLCVCMVCERRVKICPICSAKKTESFKINLP